MGIDALYHPFPAKVPVSGLGEWSWRTTDGEDVELVRSPKRTLDGAGLSVTDSLTAESWKS